MKTKSALGQLMFASLFVGAAVVAKDASLDQTLGKLDGQSRKLSGPVRSVDSSGTETNLPKSIVLRQVDGEIKIEASADAVTRSDAISFSRSYEGESWQVGGGPPDLAVASRALGGNAPANENVSVAT